MSHTESKLGDSTPAWWVWWIDNWSRMYGHRADAEVKNIYQEQYGGERWKKLMRHSDGTVTLDFNFDRTGNSPDWASARCTPEEIEAHSGGTRLQ